MNEIGHRLQLSRLVGFRASPRQERKWLRIYGILRIIWAAAMLVGLLAVYGVGWKALGEPPGSRWDSTWLWFVLPLMATVWGIFHLATGVGIVRLRRWVGSWILYGWPTLLVARLLLLYFSYEAWLGQGLALESSDAKSWFGHGLLVVVVAYDLLYVRVAVPRLSGATTVPQKSGRDSK